MCIAQTHQSALLLNEPAAPQTPQTEPSLTALADQCVMCGLCLPHCPTFRLTGTESHSPRGRVTLARALASQPALATEESYREALESCLQCRACERVCPAHVEFGALIEGARALLAEAQAPMRWMRLLSWAAAHPRASAAAIGAAGSVSRWLTLPGRNAARVRRARLPLAEFNGDSAASLFVGCVARAFEREAQVAMLAVAGRIGADLQVSSDQGCCGAMDRHLGQSAAAQACVDRNRSRFARVDTVVALDSGCIDALRRALGATTAVIEGSRWLLERAASWQPLLLGRKQRIGLFLPCSHRNVVGDVEAVRGLMRMLPGVELVDIPVGLGCCGAAGPHLLAKPLAADAFAAPVVAAAIGLGLDAMATTNVGCALHLQERLRAAGSGLVVRHPVEFLVERLGVRDVT